MTKARSAISDIIGRILPMRLSRSIRFRVANGYWPSSDNPIGLNEKINWRILHDKREVWDWTCDKMQMKAGAILRAPDVLLPVILWSGESIDDLAGVELQGRWVLKANNGSGLVYFSSGKPNLSEIRREVSRWDPERQWRVLGETAYKYADPGYFIEAWIGAGETQPRDYKVMVFDGVARFVMAHSGRYGVHRCSVYRTDWTPIPARLNTIAPHETPLEEPANLAQMLSVAERIGAGFDFARIDLFSTEEGVWFGEITPYPWSGLVHYLPEAFEIEAGSMWTLPDLAGNPARSS